MSENMSHPVYRKLSVFLPFTTMCLVFPKQALVFTCLPYKSFQKTVGKGEIPHHKQFLHFKQCFLPFCRAFMPFSSNLKLSSADSFS